MKKKPLKYVAVPVLRVTAKEFKRFCQQKHLLMYDASAAALREYMQRHQKEKS